jgi:hypothetical protein
MEEKIVGVLKDISQLVVGVVASETEDTVSLRDPVLMGIAGQGNQVNISLIPLDILSIQPTVPIRHPNIVKDPLKEMLFTFNKKNVLVYDIELSDGVVQNYRQFTNRSTIITPSTPAVVTPENNIVKLF